jgi:hemolysin III
MPQAREDGNLAFPFLMHVPFWYISQKRKDYHRCVEASNRLSDILANAITHGLGLALAVIGAVWLIAAAAHGSAWLLVSCSIFAGTLILVYLCSTLYHSLVLTGARKVFQILDHAAIYLLIAGTYTPFLLGPLRGPLGWWILGVEWTLAVAGILFKSVTPSAYTNPKLEWASALLYLAQGWLVVFAVRPLIHTLGLPGLFWLGMGGVAYTLGIAFFALDRLRFFHAAWHLFVLAGSACHYVAILFYIVPKG